jgi:hypothetical protein
MEIKMKSDLQKLCEDKKISIRCEYGMAPLNENFPDSHGYKVVLRYQGRQLTTNFYMGSAHTKEPTAADVLYCLCSDAMSGRDSFEDFCSNLGCNDDSIKALNTWKQCQKMAAKLPRFLGEEYNTFVQAEH